MTTTAAPVVHHTAEAPLEVEAQSTYQVQDILTEEVTDTSKKQEDSISDINCEDPHSFVVSNSSDPCLIIPAISWHAQV